MPLAYSYLRFSTLEQSLGNSTARQNANFSQLVIKNGLTPARQYFDSGKSAWKGGRQRELKQFLELVEGGQIEKGSWLIVESLDRISRGGFRKTQKILEAIIENGVIVATCNPERILDEKSLDDTMALLEILIIAGRAKEESDRKSERVRSAWRNKLVNAKEKIVTRRGPAWLNLKDDKWVVIPERAKVIKQIFAWTIEKGLGQRAISKRLNTLNVKPFKTSDRTSNQWNWSYIRLILTDKKVIGEFSTKAGIIKDYYPAIIDHKTFSRAQALIRQRTRKGGNTTTKVSNLFSGIAFDKEGNTMVHIRKAKDKPARFISSKYELAQIKGAASFPYEVFERKFLELFLSIDTNDIGKTNTNNKKEINKAENRIVEIDNDLAAIKEQMNGRAAITEVVAIITKLDDERKSLYKQLERLNADNEQSTPEQNLEQSQDIIKEIEQLEGDERIEYRLQLRQALRGVVDKIICDTSKDGWNTTIKCDVIFRSGKSKFLELTVRRGEFIGGKYAEPLMYLIGDKGEIYEEILEQA